MDQSVNNPQGPQDPTLPAVEAAVSEFAQRMSDDVTAEAVRGRAITADHVKRAALRVPVQKTAELAQQRGRPLTAWLVRRLLDTL